jgi:hypothetical protein
LKKLIDYKNAATMAISMLHNNNDFLNDPCTFTKNYTEFCCDKCYSAFLNMNFCSTDKNSMDPRKLIKNSSEINQPDEDFISALFNLIKNNKYCMNDAIKPLKDADQATICAMKEALRDRLLSIASRLLNSQHSKFEDLSEEDKNLGTQFDNTDIYEFITGEKDTLPEFQYNWIEPCQPAVHLPPGVLLASPQDLQPPPDQPKPPVPPPQLAAQPAQLPAHQIQPAPLAPQGVYQPDQQQPAQDQQPVAGPSRQQPQGQHDLRPRQDINYKELHTGIKQRCRKLRRQAKAVVTKLAPGSFSPKQPPPDPSSNEGPSS